MCKMAVKKVKKTSRIGMAVGQRCAALEPRVRAKCPVEIRRETDEPAANMICFA